MGLITKKDNEYYDDGIYGDYAYVLLDDIIANFDYIYVGVGKLIPYVKRSDIQFFARRALQEFNYDTLKPMRSVEMTIPDSLSIILPPDYVNYCKISWVDDTGVKRTIHNTRLTSNPTNVPLQDGNGVPMQDFDGDNLETTSIAESKWANNNIRDVTGNFDVLYEDMYIGDYSTNRLSYGKRYGSTPENTNINGFFTINEREGKVSFSSDLVGRLIIFEYISDGVAYDDMRIPKLAEEAMYAQILYYIMSNRSGVQEYVIQRLKKEKIAKLRNAKIRISNIKIEDIAQVFRNKSKIIKH